MKRGYQEIKTPLILNEAAVAQNFRTLGPLQGQICTLLKIDGAGLCHQADELSGFSCSAYKRRLCSYRDFPIRMGELGQVHRHELSGALHGLMRVRNVSHRMTPTFSCLPEQVKEEVVGVAIDFIDVCTTVFSASLTISNFPRDRRILWDLTKSGKWRRLR